MSAKLDGDTIAGAAWRARKKIGRILSNRASGDDEIC
jgi:hypothetical protein